MKFNIGDTIWIARAGPTEKWITCPDCLGSKFLTVILGDESRVTIDCVCCTHGYQGTLGKIQTYSFEETTRSETVHNVEIRLGKMRYNYNDEDTVFATKEEAHTRSLKLVEEHDIEAAEAIKNKKHSAAKSWAWNATYHRRELKRAQHDVEYHTAKLNVAKLKAKEPINEPA